MAEENEKAVISIELTENAKDHAEENKNLETIEETVNTPTKYHTESLHPEETVQNTLTTKEIGDQMKIQSENEKDLSKKIKSLSKLHENSKPIDKSIIIPKENLNNFFIKLASVSKLKTFNRSIHNNGEIKKSEIIKEENKNTEGVVLNTQPSEKNSKPTLFNTNANNKHRDTAILDERFNIEEILNDHKNNFLLTDEGIILSERMSYSSSKEEIIDIEGERDSKDERGIKNAQEENFNKTDFDTFNQKGKKEISPDKLQSIIENIKQMPVYGNTIKAPQGNKFVPGKTGGGSGNGLNKKFNPNIQNRPNLKTPPQKGTNTKITKNGSNLDSATSTTTKSTLNSVRMPPKSKSPIYQKTASGASKGGTTNGKVNSTLNTSRVNNLKSGNLAKGIKTSSMPPVSKKLTTSNKSANTSALTATSSTSTNTKTPFKKSSMNFINNMKNKNPNKLNNINSKNKLNESMNRLNTNSSKMDVLNTSNYSRKGRKNDSQRSLSSMKKRGSTDFDYKASLANEMNVIEEYDYSKILNELRAIFGEELQFFDEDMLFSNLDELSNKGLIKGLIKLSHMQDRKIKAFDQIVAKVKTQHKVELRVKDKEIRLLENELNNLKHSLRGLINEPCYTEDNILSTKSPSFSKSPHQRPSFSSKTPVKTQTSLSRGLY